VTIAVQAVNEEGPGYIVRTVGAIGAAHMVLITKLIFALFRGQPPMLEHSSEWDPRDYPMEECSSGQVH
jgi:hypothetical protein